MKKRTAIPKLVLKVGANSSGIKRLFNFSYKTLKPVSLQGRSEKRIKQMKEVFKKDRLLTGEEAARKKRIFTEGRPIESKYKRKGLTPIWGCHTQCLVFYESLKELEKTRGIRLNPKIYRTLNISVEENGVRKELPHSFVVYEFEGKKYFADPFTNELRLATKEDLKGAKEIPPKPISYEKYKKEKKVTYPFIP